MLYDISLYFTINVVIVVITSVISTKNIGLIFILSFRNSNIKVYEVFIVRQNLNLMTDKATKVCIRGMTRRPNLNLRNEREAFELTQSCQGSQVRQQVPLANLDLMEF